MAEATNERQNQWGNFLKTVQGVGFPVITALLLKIIFMFSDMRDDLQKLKLESNQSSEQRAAMQNSLNNTQVGIFDINSRLTRLETIYQINGVGASQGRGRKF